MWILRIIETYKVEMGRAPFWLWGVIKGMVVFKLLQEHGMVMILVWLEIKCVCIKRVWIDVTRKIAYRSN